MVPSWVLMKKEVDDRESGGGEGFLRGKPGKGHSLCQSIHHFSQYSVGIRKKYFSVLLLSSALIVKKGFGTLIGAEYQDTFGLGQSSFFTVDQNHLENFLKCDFWAATPGIPDSGLRRVPGMHISIKLPLMPILQVWTPHFKCHWPGAQ